MRKTILLSGPSAAGKSSLARALCFNGERFHLTTSAHLRALSGATTPSELFIFGQKLDREKPHWLLDLIVNDFTTIPVVVDAIRSHEQHSLFDSTVVRVNVVCDERDLPLRHEARGTKAVPTPFMFNRPDFVWNSSKMSLATAVAAIGQIADSGAVDVLIGGQFGSEGKGKLAAILAPGYDVLVRSGGPNAGHWVRTPDYEYCFHHLPSGTLANRTAKIVIAAGATLWGPKFWDEVLETGCRSRLQVDHNAVLITEEDKVSEGDMVGMVGSTAQGVGAAQARRLLRGLAGKVTTAWDDPAFQKHIIKVNKMLSHELASGAKVMLEGTQGSQLSLYHGEYPFTTSRDTNVSGLLSEVGIAPSLVRDSWLVFRTFPIRVGGNSGPMENELDWGEIAGRSGQNTDTLKVRELTSTTKRQRRVGEFSWSQFKEAIVLNRPTKLFLSFADYIHPAAAKCQEYGKLPDDVLRFVERMELESGVPVAGISTGRQQADTIMRGRYGA